MTDNLPNPTDMTPKNRQAEIISIRRRLRSGEKLPDGLVQRGLLLIRADRTERKGTIPKSKKAPSKVEAFDLSDF